MENVYWKKSAAITIFTRNCWKISMITLILVDYNIQLCSTIIPMNGILTNITIIGGGTKLMEC